MSRFLKRASGQIAIGSGMPFQGGDQCRHDSRRLFYTCTSTPPTQYYHIMDTTSHWPPRPCYCYPFQDEWIRRADMPHSQALRTRPARHCPLIPAPTVGVIAPAFNDSPAKRCPWTKCCAHLTVPSSGPEFGSVLPWESHHTFPSQERAGMSQ